MYRTTIFYYILVVTLLFEFATNAINLGWGLINLFLVFVLIEYAQDMQKKEGFGLLMVVEILASYISTIFIVATIGSKDIHDASFPNLIIAGIFLGIDGLYLILKNAFVINPRNHF